MELIQSENEIKCFRHGEITASELGRLGGKARMARLTPEERRKLSMRGVRARIRNLKRLKQRGE